MAFDIANLIIGLAALAFSGFALHFANRRVQLQQRLVERGERSVKLREYRVEEGVYGFYNHYEHRWEPEEVPGLELVLVNPSEKPIKLISIRGKTVLGYVPLPLHRGEFEIGPETSETATFRGDKLAGPIEELRLPRDKPVSLLLEARDELGNLFDLGEIFITPSEL